MSMPRPDEQIVLLQDELMGVKIAGGWNVRLWEIWGLIIIRGCDRSPKSRSWACYTEINNIDNYGNNYFGATN